VREQLLHILGGGITRVAREEYPAPLGMALALRVMLHPTEVDASHKLRVLLQDEDGKPVAEIGAEFGIQDVGEDVQPGEEISLALPLLLYDLPLPAPGAYSFELLIDGIHQTAVPFLAR
jgi:hypothetical protein